MKLYRILFGISFLAIVGFILWSNPIFKALPFYIYARLWDCEQLLTWGLKC